MAVITNPDTAGHFCNTINQWIPARCTVTVTSAQAAAVPTNVFTTASSLEVIATAPEDGTPSNPTRAHR